MRLGDAIETLAKPIAKALHLGCLDESGELRPESGCAKRRDFLNQLTNKPNQNMIQLPAIPLTSDDVAMSHARQLRKALLDIDALINAHYGDFPAGGEKILIDPVTKAKTIHVAHPACPKASIQARLGPQIQATVEAVQSALATASPAPAAPQSAPPAPPAH